MQSFVVMIDYGRRGREAVVDPEVTRREIVARVASGEYRNVSFIHEIVDRSVDDVTEATNTLADDLATVGEPETQDGRKAEDLVDQLAVQIDEGAKAIENAVDDVKGGTGILAAISTISATLASMTSEIGGIVDQLEQLDPGGELDDAFKNADECASLSSGG